MSQFLKGRNVGIEFAAGIRHHSQNLQRACIDLALEHAGVRQGRVDMFACQGSRNVGASFRIGNVFKLYVKFLFKVQRGNMPDGAGTGVAHGNLAGIVFCIFYKLIQGIVRRFLRNDQGCGSRNGRAHGNIILVGHGGFALMGEHGQLYRHHT